MNVNSACKCTEGGVDADWGGESSREELIKKVVGYRITAKSPDGAVICYCIVREASDKMLMLEVESGTVPTHNQSIVLGGGYKSYKQVWSATAVKCDDTIFCAKNLHKVSDEEQRRWYRAEISIPTHIRADEPKAPLLEIRIVNLSLKGLAFRTQRELDITKRYTTNFILHNNPLSVKFEICRSREVCPGVFEYGCSLIDLGVVELNTLNSFTIMDQMGKVFKSEE